MPVKSVRVELYRDVIKSELHELVTPHIAVVTLRVFNRARVLTPVDTGNLRASHQVRFRQSANRNIGEVFTKVKYALPLHEGRGAVTIYPKKKQALAFVWHGQPMVRRSVFQRPRGGKPWLRNALREVAASEGYKMQSAAAMDASFGDL
jgi:hypothetical protein